MFPTPIQGSAKILDFRPRSRVGSAALKGAPAAIVRLQAPAPVQTILDIDGWYHAEAMDAQRGGKR